MKVETGNEVAQFISRNSCFKFLVQCMQITEYEHQILSYNSNTFYIFEMLAKAAKEVVDKMASLVAKNICGCVVLWQFLDRFEISVNSLLICYLIWYHFVAKTCCFHEIAELIVFAKINRISQSSAKIFFISRKYFYNNVPFVYYCWTFLHLLWKC